MYVCFCEGYVKGLWVLCHGAKNFFGSWHENLFWKSCSEMSLKKVMYNQHVPYMHTPISAFACYNTPLQASYQSDTCKRRTKERRLIMNAHNKMDKTKMVGVWLSCHLPLGSNVCSGEPPRQSPLCPPLSKLMRKKSHWRTVMCVSVFFFRQSSTDKPCVSVGLVSRLASPNSLHRRDNQPYCLRIALTRTLHQRAYVSI